MAHNVRIMNDLPPGRATHPARSRWHRLSPLVLCCALAGCQTATRTADVAPVQIPVVDRSGAVIERCYQLLPDASEVRILAYRDGPLARLGHNHVLVGRGLAGGLAVTRPSEASTFRLRLAVDSLSVDPPAARAEEGQDFTSEVSEQARAGTRENLLGAKVLDAAQFPFVEVALLAMAGPFWAPDLLVRVRIRDQVHDVPVAVGVWEDEDRLLARGSFSVRQSDFGMTPFSVLGGGLRVRDDLKIRMQLSFGRVAPSATGACPE
jgi:hypothetical protein